MNSWQRRQCRSVSPRGPWLLLFLWLVLVVSSTQTTTTCRRALFGILPSSHFGTRTHHHINPFLLKAKRKHHDLPSLQSLQLQLRGGGAGGEQEVAAEEEESKAEEAEAEAEEEERYSRQVYTLGKRAHGLIRASTIYLDGPPQSGLLYEIAKNLALSGVQRIVLVVNNDDNENNNSAYHQPKLDDLGIAYARAASAEINSGRGDDDDTDAAEESAIDILREYIQRLNPSVQVETWQKSSGETALKKRDNGGPVVYMAIDRSQSACVALNEQIRRQRRRQDDDNNAGDDVHFVAVDTAGVYGIIFCDFGNDDFTIHDADGETALSIPLLHVTSEPGGDEKGGDADIVYMVHCMPEEKHDVSKGDRLQFQLRNGQVLENIDCVVERVHSPYKVQVTFHQEAAALDRIHEAVAFSRIKQAQTLQFVPMRQALEQVKEGGDSNLVTPSDLDKSFDTERQKLLLRCFSNLDRFVNKHGRVPTKTEEDVKAAQESAGAPQEDDSSVVVANFVQSCAAKFVPLQGVVGAIAAQEALKAVSGLYTPIHQFLLFDCEEVLSSSSSDEKKKEPAGDDSDDNNESSSQRQQAKGGSSDGAGLRHILGDAVVDSLQQRKLFVVGAGAIGCELLKNLASMGVATATAAKGGGGKLILTDMDTIEKSNLSRQLLFRDFDLGQFKSVAAEKASLLFNPHCQIQAHSAKVGGGGGGGDTTPFDEDFWSQQVDIVLNALDNVDARLYMDGQCVKYHKALIDAGTMGPKGNVQVVVPLASESYASQADPPTDSIAVCTLKNFPYAIAHTIQWARDLFDGLYVQRARHANDLVQQLLVVKEATMATIADKLMHSSGEEAVLTLAQELAEDFAMVVPDEEDDHNNTNFSSLRSNCLEWAVALSQKLYVESVDALLQQHPLDSKDEDGEVFWSGTRRPPSRLFYDDASDSISAEQELINQNLISFVQNAARLRSETFLSSQQQQHQIVFSAEEAKAVLSAANGKPGQKEVCHNEDDEERPQSTRDQVLRHLSEIDGAAAVAATTKFYSAEFEKDDDSNGHIAFITAASNLRAIAYSIPTVDAMETRRVAGKIIPAMISTTALVSALQCLELIKLVQKAPLHKHRNAFVNLALPFFAFTAPLPAETTPGLGGREYTLWDQLSISESQKAAKKGGLTVKALLKRIQKLASDDPSTVGVASVSLGPYLLYANFLHEDDTELLQSSVWEVIGEALDSEDDEELAAAAATDEEELAAAAEQVFSINDHVFDLTVVVEDLETGEEAELPTIRLRRFQP